MTIPLKIADGYKPYSGNCPVYVPQGNEEARSKSMKPVNVAYTDERTRKKKRILRESHGVSLKEHSLAIGKSSTWLWVVRKHIPHFFRYMRFHGKGDMTAGHRHFESYLEDIKKRLEPVQLSDVDALAAGTGISRYTIRTMLRRLNDGSPMSQYNTVKRMRDVLRVWERMR